MLKLKKIFTKFTTLHFCIMIWPIRVPVQAMVAPSNWCLAYWRIHAVEAAARWFEAVPAFFSFDSFRTINLLTSLGELFICWFESFSNQWCQWLTLKSFLQFKVVRHSGLKLGPAIPRIFPKWWQGSRVKVSGPPWCWLNHICPTGVLTRWFNWWIISKSW